MKEKHSTVQAILYHAFSDPDTLDRLKKHLKLHNGTKIYPRITTCYLEEVNGNLETYYLEFIIVQQFGINIMSFAATIVCAFKSEVNIIRSIQLHAIEVKIPLLTNSEELKNSLYILGSRIYDILSTYNDISIRVPAEEILPLKYIKKLKEIAL